MMTVRKRWAWCAGAAVALSCAVVLAQGQAQVVDATGLAALTAEIRQLRTAVEESARTQTQTQALAVYLSVQQSRFVQFANSLDASRKILDSATLRLRQLAEMLAHANQELSRATDLQMRGRFEAEIAALKMEQNRVNMELQQAQSRDLEISQAMQLEEVRWNDLISRLEQLLKR